MDVFDMFKAQEDHAPTGQENAFQDQGLLEPLSRSSLDVQGIENAVVIALPGALLFRKGVFRLHWLNAFSKALEGLSSQSLKVAVVVGEGSSARPLAHAARQLGVGMEAVALHEHHSSRLHAALVGKGLFMASDKPCENIEEALALMRAGKIPVLVGRVDQQSLEGYAALLAESLHAKLVVLTLGEIPRKVLSHASFSKMAQDVMFKQKKEFVVDGLTVSVLARSSIETFLLSEKFVSQLDRALNGHSFEGTRVVKTDTS